MVGQILIGVVIGILLTLAGVGVVLSLLCHDQERSEAEEPLEGDC